MKILFICHANICRSFAAQELLKRYLPEVEVFSRGMYADPAYTVPQKIWDYLQTKAVAPSAHQSTLLCKQDLERADYVFVMEQKQADLLLDRYAQYTDKIYLLSDFAFDQPTDVADPVGLSGRAFVKQMDLLDKAVRSCAEKLKQKGGNV